MAETPANGETQTPGTQNNGTPSAPVTPTVTPPAGNTDSKAELELLRKEKEQAEMRANQLANQLKAKDDAEAAAAAKALEENQEFKTLWEQEKAEKERLAAERDAESKKQTLASEEKKITDKYAPEVLEIANELGFSLTDSSEEATKAFAAKLDKVQEKVGGKTPVGPNNNPQQRQVNTGRAEKIAEFRKTGDKSRMDEAIAELSFVKPYNPQQ